MHISSGANASPFRADNKRGIGGKEPLWPFRAYTGNKFATPWGLSEDKDSAQGRLITFHTDEVMPSCLWGFYPSDESLDCAGNRGIIGFFTNVNFGRHVAEVLAELQRTNIDLETIAHLRETITDSRNLVEKVGKLKKAIEGTADCGKLLTAINNADNGIDKSTSDIKFRARGWRGKTEKFLKYFENADVKRPLTVYGRMKKSRDSNGNMYGALYETGTKPPLMIMKVSGRPEATELYMRIVQEASNFYPNGAIARHHMAFLDVLREALPVISIQLKSYWETGALCHRVMEFKDRSDSILNIVERLNHGLKIIDSKENRIAPLVYGRQWQRVDCYVRHGHELGQLDISFS